MTALPKSFKATESKLEQKIDVSSVFGVDLSNNPRLMQELGQACLDRIVDRCENDNKDIFGEKFKEYSKEYINSDTFDDFNKSANDRNMTLTGKMLEDIDFTTSGNDLTLEVTANNGKAYNHQVGDTTKQRAWFGIGDNDIKKIKEDFEDDFSNIKKESIRSVVDLMAANTIEKRIAENNFIDLFNASGIGFDLDGF